MTTRFILRLVRTTAILSLTFALLGCTAGMMSTEQAASLRAGMTKVQVVEAYGKPLQVNTTRTAGTTREQWVYDTPESRGGLSYKQVYVYFEGGEVTSVQY